MSPVRAAHLAARGRPNRGGTPRGAVREPPPQPRPSTPGPRRWASPSPEGPRMAGRARGEAASPGSRVLDGCTGEQPLDVGRHRRPKPQVSPFVWEVVHAGTVSTQAPAGGRDDGVAGRGPGQTLGHRAVDHISWTRRRDAGPGRRPGRGSRPGRTVARPRAPRSARAGAPAHRDARKLGTRSAPPHVRNGRAEAVGSPITRPVASSVVRA